MGGFVEDVFGEILNLVDDVAGSEYGPDEQEKKIRAELEKEQGKLRDQLNSANATERLAAEVRMGEIESSSKKDIATMRAEALVGKQKQDKKHAIAMSNLEKKEAPQKFDRKKFTKARKRAITQGAIMPTRNPVNETRPGSDNKPRTTSERRPQ
jgi:hypothetical protein